jgi:putative phosphonate catabolism associated alcohol dehydrogenase
MRAALFHGPGRPLELASFAVPEPVGEEVLVRVTLCTLCRSDLHTHSGRRAGPTPSVLGHEIVGRVKAFGPSAPRRDWRGRPAAVGDRISWTVTASCGRCFYCAEHLPQKCERLFKYGHEAVTIERPFGGGLADYVLLKPGTAWLIVPDEIPDVVAAPANCATATVAAVLRSAGELSGRRVLILGAGVLGLTACAMARAAGAAAVMVSDPNPQARQRALAFGATHALCDLLEVHDLTGGRGADVAVELAGVADSVRAGLSLVRIGGTLILAGTVSPTPTVPLDPEDVVRRMVTIRGVHNYQPRDLEAALDFLAGPGRNWPFESLVGATFPLERIEEAFAHAHAHPGLRTAVVP